MITDLSVEDRNGIVDALNKSAMGLYQRADDCINDPDFYDLEDMYRGDAADYESILNDFVAGRYDAARSTFWHMDTASRDNVFEFLTSSVKGAFETFIYTGR